MPCVEKDQGQAGVSLCGIERCLVQVIIIHIINLATRLFIPFMQDFMNHPITALAAGSRRVLD